MVNFHSFLFGQNLGQMITEKLFTHCTLPVIPCLESKHVKSWRTRDLDLEIGKISFRLVSQQCGKVYCAKIASDSVLKVFFSSIYIDLHGSFCRTDERQLLKRLQSNYFWPQQYLDFFGSMLCLTQMRLTTLEFIILFSLVFRSV